MLYDAETRILIAAERSALLRSHAASAPRDRRARRWLGNRLIAVGLRLASERAMPAPARSVAA